MIDLHKEFQADTAFMGVWQDWLFARATALAEELAAVEFAAHMPDDYEFGLPSWIEQRLYASWIGALFSPEVQRAIADGKITFADAPMTKENEVRGKEIALLKDFIESQFPQEIKWGAWTTISAIEIIEKLRAELAALKSPTPESPYDCGFAAYEAGDFESAYVNGKEGSKWLQGWSDACRGVRRNDATMEVG